PFGAGLLEECREAMVHGLYIGAALTPVITAATFAIMEMLPRCGLTPSVMDQLVPCMGTLTWGTLPLLLYFGLRRYLQGMNVVGPTSFVLISANVVNAFFNWVLIYGNLDAPAMGLMVSAAPTHLARSYLVGVPA